MNLTRMKMLTKAEKQVHIDSLGGVRVRVDIEEEK